MIRGRPAFAVLASTIDVLTFSGKLYSFPRHFFVSQAFFWYTRIIKVLMLCVNNVTPVGFRTELGYVVGECTRSVGI